MPVEQRNHDHQSIRDALMLETKNKVVGNTIVFINIANKMLLEFPMTQ